MKPSIREIENETLSFRRVSSRGAIQETFFPWTLTQERWEKEGLPTPLDQGKFLGKADVLSDTPSFGCRYHVCDFEQHFGLDGIARCRFYPPHGPFPIELPLPPVFDEASWRLYREQALREIEKTYTEDQLRSTFAPLVAGHRAGKYSVRLNIEGFFWFPRTLFDIEQHLFAFYDHAAILHEINRFLLDFYLDKLAFVLDILPADLVYIMEDLSGSTGPMISPALFDEFVGAYYVDLVKMLKAKGVRHVFVDTDGDFTSLIPNFLAAGIEGFLPVDVNAGMDILALRRDFPRVKLIGGFNKLAIAQGPEAIDAEFARLLPIIRQGGYIVGADHQVAPSTSLAHYHYYLKRLAIAMQVAGHDGGTVPSK